MSELLSEGQNPVLTFPQPLWYYLRSSMRGGAVAARRAHNPKVTGSSPVPATNRKKTITFVMVFLFYN